MRICQPHWNRLREALALRGLSHLGAKTPQEAFAAVVTELEGRGAENDFDPLLLCNNMIFSEGLRRCGLVLMDPQPDDTHLCPICESQRQYGEWWINGPADAALEEARRLGLVPTPPACDDGD